MAEKDNLQNSSIVAAEECVDDSDFATIRPKKLDSFIGQQKIKENIKIHMEAAVSREEPLEHLLLYGPPGLGKTTLANIISNEMGVNIKITSGPAIERAGDLAAILTNLKEKDVLFIDEIHRLNRQVEEILYPAMEDFAIDIVIGKGPSARSIRLDLPRFTLIGATTRAGQLSSPLRDRFGMISRLEFYACGDLSEIVKRAAKVLKLKIDQVSADEIARRSRGTPRVALRLLRRVRDFAQVKANGKFTPETTHQALGSLEIDEFGLDKIDRKLLKTIISKFNGGPVGIDTLAAMVSEEVETLEDIYEPFLMQLGFIDRTPRGRIATAEAYGHLKLQSNQPDLQEKLWKD
jgi:holliday junction DNA helicase RuvB